MNPTPRTEPETPFQTSAAEGAARLLLVDDRDDGLLALRSALEGTGASIVWAQSGQEALARLLEGDFAAILLDIRMPVMDGFETARLIRARPATRHVPILFVTGLDPDGPAAARAYALGAVDFITKPFHPDILRAKVGVFIELHRRAQEVRESRARYDSLAELAPVGVFHTDAAGACLWVNPRWCEIAGLAPGEARGEGWAKAIHPDDRARVVEEWSRAAAERKLFRSEYRFRRPDGRTTWVIGQAKAQAGPDGRVQGYVGTITDISERKAAEEASERRAAQAREELALIADAVPVLISHVDRHERYVRVNRAYEDWFGLKREEVEGHTLREVIGEAGYGRIEPHVRAALSGRPVSFEAVIPYRRGGTRHIRGDYVPQRDGGYVAVIVDISEVKRVEEEARARAQELERLMESVPAVVWIAHDPDCRRISGNRAAQEILGLHDGANHSLTAPTAEAPRNFRVFRASDGKDLAGDELPVQAAARGAEAREVEVRIVSDDGSERTLFGNAVPLRAADGSPRGAVAAFVDVTERRRREAGVRFLAEAGRILSSSLDYEATIGQVADLAVRQIADWCVVDVGEGDALRRLAVAHREPGKVAWARELSARYPADPRDPQGVWNVYRTGRPELAPEITDEMLRAYAKDGEHYRLLSGLGLCSAMLVPMAASGRVLGVLTYVSTDPRRRYGPADLELAEALAERAALALENARLFRERTRQKEHLALLSEASRLFAESSLDLPELMGRLSRLLVPGLADSCYVRRLSDDGATIRTLGVRHVDPELEAREREITSGPQPADQGMTGEILRSGKPVFMPVLDPEAFRQAVAPQYRAVAQRSGMRGYLMVAMRVRGKAVGALGLGRMAGRPPFTLEDLEAAQKIADRVGLALATFDAFRLLQGEKEELGRSEARFRALADNAPDIIARYDRDGRHLYVNPRAEKATGVPARDFLGRTLRELGMPEDAYRELERHLGEAFAGQEVRYDFDFPGLAGRCRYQALLVPERGPRGSVASVLALARDVTELAERARRGEETLSSISGMADKLGSLLGPEELLEAVAVDAVRLVGAESGLAAARTEQGLRSRCWVLRGETRRLEIEWPSSLLELKAPRAAADGELDGHPLRERLRSMLRVPVLGAQGEMQGFLELHNKLDGPGFSSEDADAAWALSRMASIALQNALAFQRARRAELEERRKTAELADTLRELETFAYSVAHDLRAPVRAMTGYGQVLVDAHGEELGASGRGLCERISEAGRRMDQMIQDLLAYSRLSREELALVPVELEDVADAALRQVEADAASRRAEIAIERPLPAVRGQAAVLTQALANLLSNALKFVAPGVAPQVRLRAEERGGAVRLWVEDNGIGIPAEHQAKLFRVFERLQPANGYPGTGIGLAIVRRGLERGGGGAAVESAEGRGSRFWIELPKA